MPQLEQRTSGLLPAKIKDEFLLFHRPMPNMWLSRSRDLKSWHDSQCIFETRPGTWYENKLGIGAPPLPTPYGWLLFWHGKNNKNEYALRIMLLDRENPGKILKVQEETGSALRDALRERGICPECRIYERRGGIQRQVLCLLRLL